MVLYDPPDQEEHQDLELARRIGPPGYRGFRGRKDGTYRTETPERHRELTQNERVVPAPSGTRD